VASLWPEILNSDGVGQFCRAGAGNFSRAPKLSVVLFHAGVPFLRGGFIGVDIFFVISGYLISSHIYRDLKKGAFSLRSFYEKRARRILPALLTVLAVCTILGCILFAPRELEVLSAHTITAITSTSNIFFWLRTDYFAPHAELKPLLMTWSLGVEEQFYLLFPLLLAWLWRLGRRRLILSLTLISVLSFAVAAFQVLYHQTSSFYLLPSRWWELGLGTILGVYEASRAPEETSGATYLGRNYWVSLDFWESLQALCSIARPLRSLAWLRFCPLEHPSCCSALKEVG
jgi:peptidoglycan/LPS O-acetylase OafA/YrhL